MNKIIDGAMPRNILIIREITIQSILDSHRHLRLPPGGGQGGRVAVIGWPRRRLGWDAGQRRRGELQRLAGDRGDGQKQRWLAQGFPMGLSHPIL